MIWRVFKIGACYRSLAVAVLFALAFRAENAELQNWTRDLVQDSTDSELRQRHLYVAVTASTDGHLSALCIYRRATNNESLVIHGKNDEDGEFSPVASYQVRPAAGGDWLQIARTSESRETLSVPAIMKLSFDMEAFRSFLGRFRWGRIVLENNETAVLDLEDLLPPPSPLQRNRDFKYVTGQVHAETRDSAAFLHSVISLNGHLTGVFLYVKADIGERHRINEAKTPAGEFSPFAELDVSADGTAWKPVAKSDAVSEEPRSIEPSSKAAVFRINLDAYKSSLGTYKLGKIVFSDGSFAVFRLCQLTAQCGR